MYLTPLSWRGRPKKDLGKCTCPFLNGVHVDRAWLMSGTNGEEPAPFRAHIAQEKAPGKPSLPAHAGKHPERPGVPQSPGSPRSSKRAKRGRRRSLLKGWQICSTKVRNHFCLKRRRCLSPLLTLFRPSSTRVQQVPPWTQPLITTGSWIVVSKSVQQLVPQRRKSRD